MVIVNGSYFEVTAHTLTLIDHGASGLEMNVDVQFTHTAGTFAGAVFYRAQLFKAAQATPVYTLYSNTLGLTSHRITRDASDIVVEAGSYTLKVFAQLNGSAEADAYAESDVVLVDGGGDAFDDEIKYRLVENRELTWEEGDSNFRILDRRSRAKFSLPENSFWKGDATNKPIPVDFEGAVAATEALAGKLDKTLSEGMMWVGDSENTPVEIPIAGISPFKTVGAGGAYATIKEAVDAGFTSLIQVGAIAENVAFNISGKHIVVFGNRAFSISITGVISSSTNGSISFKNATVTTSTNVVFSSTNTSMRVYFEECSITQTDQKLFTTQPYWLIFKKCFISITQNANPIGCIFVGEDIQFSNPANTTFDFYMLKYASFSNTCTLRNYGVAVRLINSQSTNMEPLATEAIWLNCDLPTASPIANSTNKSIIIGGAIGYVGAGYLRMTGVTIKWGGSYTPVSCKMQGCTFGSAVTLTTCELLHCITAGITLTGADSTIIGGTHTTIAVNGSKNLVTGVRATSITIAASLSKCRITQNITTNAITETDPGSHYYAGNFTA